MHFIGGQEEDKWDLMFAKVLWINKTHLSSEESFNLVEPTISTKTQYPRVGSKLRSLVPMPLSSGSMYKDGIFCIP